MIEDVAITVTCISSPVKSDKYEDDDDDDVILVSQETASQDTAPSTGGKEYLYNTIIRTNRDIKIFKEWLSKHGESSDVETMTAEQLNKALEQFYVRYRTRTGTPYNKNTLLAMRASLNRYFVALPEGQRKNLIRQKEFSSSNAIISNKDKGSISPYKRPISKEDLARIISSSAISTDEPFGLLRKVWFDLMLHFGLKGREALRELRKDSFIIRTDEEGHVYYMLNPAHAQLIRTHSEMQGWFWESRMYAEADDIRCPVRSLNLYLSKTSPMCEFLFQRPQDCSHETDKVCYNGPAGSAYLARLMGEISSEAKLSTTYSTTCIMATVQHKMAAEPMDSTTRLLLHRLMAPSACHDQIFSMSSQCLRECSFYLHSWFYNPK